MPVMSHIDIQPGVQVLDGKNAEEFVRFRQYPEGDLGRVKAQQQFM
jgi:anionic cell wall polymer biosynthesis LytR-Cps2A-Psr (LCP) family protein